MLIYLNRTGFNGLFRVNARGGFNVPAGRYARPRIADRDKLARVADALSARARAAAVGIVRGRARRSRRPATSSTSIRRTRRSAGPRTSRRTRRRGSTPRDQERLQQVVIDARARAAATCWSATRPPTRSRRSTNTTRTRSAPACARSACRRAAPINSNAARRGAVDEYLITNIAGRPRSRPALRRVHVDAVGRVDAATGAVADGAEARARSFTSRRWPEPQRIEVGELRVEAEETVARDSVVGRNRLENACRSARGGQRSERRTVAAAGSRGAAAAAGSTAPNRCAIWMCDSPPASSDAADRPRAHRRTSRFGEVLQHASRSAPSGTSTAANGR